MTKNPSHTRRRHPRLATEIPAMLALRPRAAGAKDQTIWSLITTLSSAGAGLVPAIDGDLDLRRGQPVSLSFFVKGKRLSIRSQVAWQATSPSGRTTLGLEMLLTLCPSETRESYLEWLEESAKTGTMTTESAPE